MLGRHRTEIIAQILEVVNDGSSGGEGVTRTRIMYKAFLSYAQLKEYLTILTHNGLLSYDIDTQTFKVTERGHSFLRAYGQLDQLTNERQTKYL